MAIGTGWESQRQTIGCNGNMPFMYATQGVPPGCFRPREACFVV
jgi:hypothetical protein